MVEVVEQHDIVMPECLQFPKTVKIRPWCIYLGRKLNWKERYIIENAKSEIYMNERLTDLNKCLSDDLHVPALTELDGNCMFASLVYHKIGNSVEEIRKGLSYIMYTYQNYKNFFPKNDMTLKEQFSFANEIEYVYLKKKKDDPIKDEKEETKKIYKYTYNVMCQDLSNLDCWTRLPTEVILRTLCLLFNLHIIVYHDNGHKTEINVYENVDNADTPELTKIYLGHLGESHYVPVDVKTPDNSDTSVFYTDAKEKFIKWAHCIENLKISIYKTRLAEYEAKNVEKEAIKSDNASSDEEEFVNLEAGKENQDDVLVNFSENKEDPENSHISTA